MKGRKVPPLQPGERKQYAPGQLQRSLRPNVRARLEQLAVEGYAREGRGALSAELDDTAPDGISETRYISLQHIGAAGGAVALVGSQPLMAEIRRYDPAREFVVMIMDVTPTLPGPQLWFDVFPREAAG